MKRLFILTAILFFVAPVFAQEENVTDTSECKSSIGGIVGVSFSTSTMNDNSMLSNKLGIDDINKVNIGLDYYVGIATKKGFEYTLGVGFEGWNNEQNNKQLQVFSGLLNLNAAYRFEFGKKKSFAIVPRVGIGWNFNALNYAEEVDRSIVMDELSLYSWSVEQNCNFYIPASLELRYLIGKGTFFTLGAEYRYNFYYGNTYVMNTHQKVLDFPEIGNNKLMFRIGITSLSF